MQTKLNYALEFIKRGIAVIPLRHRGKEPESRLMGGTWEQHTTNLPTEHQVRNWLASGWQNYGVVCGWQNLTVIDFDNEIAFAVWMQYASILFKHGVLPVPFIVKTRRGAHVYITTPSMRENGKRQGVDIQANHKYVVGPSAIHPSGAIYQPMGTMIFPEVYDLNTILPLDLFPLVAKAESFEAIVNVDWNASPAVRSDAYDPFQIASGRAQGLDLIGKVKSSVRIENLFPDARRTSNNGQWFAVRCLFHDDQKASAWVDVKRQIYGCEVCQMKPMDVINVYARTHHMSDSAAVSALAQEAGIWG